MSETYRKRGQTVRFEHGRLIQIAEAGEAVEAGELFTAAPIVAQALEPIDETAVLATARAIESLIAPPVAIERLVVLQGVAEHDCDGIVWREELRRIHLSLQCGSLRALIDLGEFEIDSIATIARSLARAGATREAPKRVRLAQNVSAALLPSLINMIPIDQTAAPHDGKGQPVREQRLVKEPWPNWYRPTYRLRPVRMPFHLRAVPTVDTINDDVPRAVALLAPVDRRSVKVLCIDGEEVYPTVLTVDRVSAVAADAKWYPYAAGSFGAEMLL